MYVLYFRISERSNLTRGKVFLNFLNHCVLLIFFLEYSGLRIPSLQWLKYTHFRELIRPKGNVYCF